MKLLDNLEAHNAMLDHARRLELALKVAEEALRLLHDNVDDYQRINNLSGHDNHDMRLARAALAQIAELKERSDD